MKTNRRPPCFPLIVLVAFFSTYGCGTDTTSVNTDAASPRPEPPYDWADPGLSARLDGALDGWAEDFGLYGAAAAVHTPGWLDWSGSTGMRDIQTAAPYETAALGRIASITKSFTSTIILQLVDEGLLTLDTPLARFVRDYPNGENITVEHLLRHRSGIPEIHTVDGIFLLSLILRPQRWLTPEEVLEWTYLPIPILHIYREEFIPREPVGVPGGDFHYSQSGYIALGIIIEKVTGKALADVYHERIFEPLGMTEAYLPRKDAPFEPWGYTNLLGLLDEEFPSKYLGGSANWLNSAGWSAAAIIATARELVVFLSGMLEGRLFSPEGLANATDWMEIRPGDDANRGEYGLGLFRSRHDGFSTVGHTGSLPGSGAIMQYIPELDIYIGAVTNTDLDADGASDLVVRIRRALLNDS
jgi:D-alanyl-D-alanine carboxypeptidase